MIMMSTRNLETIDFEDVGTRRHLQEGLQVKVLKESAAYGGDHVAWQSIQVP
jgi:hypothetical protein